MDCQKFRVPETFVFADQYTYTTKTNGSRTQTNVLGDLNKGVGHLRGVGTAGLDTDGGNLGAGRVQEGGGALHGVEGSGLAAGDCLSNISYYILMIGLHLPMAWLTRVGAAELLELDWRASDLDGALGSH